MNISFFKKITFLAGFSVLLFAANNASAVNNPAPSITSISPSSATVGSSGVNATITGTGFITSSEVRWNGAFRTSQTLSSSQIQFSIPQTDLGVAGKFNVTVTNPAPGGGTSNIATFSVNADMGTLVILKSTPGNGTPTTFNYTIFPTPSAVSVTTAGSPNGGGQASLQLSSSISSYIVSETLPAGWTLTSATCTRGTPSAVIILAGQTTTCTFTNTFSPKLNPTVSLALTPPSPVVSGTQVRAKATIGFTGQVPTGTVTYQAFTDNFCTATASLLDNKLVDAFGVVPDSNSVLFTNIATFYWKAVYSGDTKYNSASSSCVPLTVNPVVKVTPTITTVLSVGNGATITPGTSVFDTATFTVNGQPVNPGGAVDFYVYTGTVANNGCLTGGEKIGLTKVVSGSSVQSDSLAFNPPSLPITYKWKAYYYPSANSNYNASVSDCNSEVMTVATATPPPPTTYTLTVNYSDATGVIINSYPISNLGWGSTTPVTAPATFNNLDFSNWSNCTSVNGRTCSVNITSNKTVTATYIRPPVTPPPPTPLTITALNPSSTNKDVAPPFFNITGTGFLSGAVINFGTTNIIPTTVLPTVLTATIPASAVATAGTINVKVTNPGGAFSNTLPFTVNNVTTPPPPPTTYNLSVNATNSLGPAKVNITSSNSAYGGQTFYNVSASGTFTLTAPPTFDTIVAGIQNFQSWQGCSTVTGNVCTLNMTTNTSVTATYIVPPTPPPASPKLTVTKVVVNNGGGTKLVSDFPLFVSATAVTSGVQTTFAAGTYTVSETTQANYTAVISGDCSASGSVTLSAGNVKSCTITNTYVPPVPTTGTLKIVKNTPGTTASADFDYYVGSPYPMIRVKTSNGTGYESIDLPASTTRTINEIASIGWKLVSISCKYGTANTPTGTVTGNSVANVTVAAGQITTCTFTNTLTAPATTITVNKVCSPATDSGKFYLKIGSQIFDTSCGGTTGPQQVTAGQAYVVGETAGIGTDLADYTSAISGDCASNGSITLAAGENKTCTITNTKKPAPTTGTLKIIKKTDKKTGEDTIFNYKISQ